MLDSIIAPLFNDTTLNASATPTHIISNDDDDMPHIVKMVAKCFHIGT